MSDSLKNIEIALRDFATARDWHQFHTPKNLILALVGEVGELAELYRWHDGSELVPGAASEEMADVLIFLVRLADVTGVDLIAATNKKVLQNAENYPVDKSRGNAIKRKGGEAVNND